jgi:hypothetical protein
MSPLDLEPWLRRVCSVYEFDVRGAFRVNPDASYPLVANDAYQLEAMIVGGGHLLPLPKESAALANVLEVGIVDYLIEGAAEIEGLVARRGSERGYPDMEFSGDALDGEFHAVDIKIARRKKLKQGVSKNTESRITLYTGNTYFRYPSLHWPGTFRPFADYASHLDVLGIYTLNEDSTGRVDDLELIVQPSWKIASKQRSSTTREYIGAVMEIDALREGRGEFSTIDEFYKYWNRYPFKIGKAVQQQLDKLLAARNR